MTPPNIGQKATASATSAIRNGNAKAQNTNVARGSRTFAAASGGGARAVAAAQAVNSPPLSTRGGNLYDDELRVACEAVKLASHLCVASQRELLAKETHSKDDTSPVTVADLGSQAIISWALQNLPRGAAPDSGASSARFSLVAEEDSELLRSAAGQPTRERVVELVNATLASSDLPPLSEAEVLDAIDRGDSEGGSEARHWVLDPIDGTRGFVGNRQYAIALALLDHGEPVVGVLGCPNLSLTDASLDNRTDRAASEGAPLAARSDQDASSPGCLFLAQKARGAFASAIGVAGGRDGQEGSEDPIVCGAEGGLESIRINEVSPAEAVYMESVETRHSDHAFARRVAERAGLHAAPLRIDSQAKYGVIAAGRASAFMRFPDVSYEEKIWDHAAGAIIMAEAGGVVTDAAGKPLDFSKGRVLNNASGIVAAPPILHGRLIESIREERQGGNRPELPPDGLRGTNDKRA